MLISDLDNKRSGLDNRSGLVRFKNPIFLLKLKSVQILL